MLYEITLWGILRMLLGFVVLIVCSWLFVESFILLVQALKTKAQTRRTVILKEALIFSLLCVAVSGGGVLLYTYLG